MTILIQRIILLTLALATNLSATGTTQQQWKSQTQEIIETWRTDNGIKLPNKSYQLLIEQAGSGRPRRTAHLERIEISVKPTDTHTGKPGPTRNSKNTSTTWTYSSSSGGELLNADLFEAYLYELRDRVLYATGSLLITAKHIETYSYYDFLASLVPTTDTGWLIIKSEPKLATIAIDSIQRGSTDKKLIISTGSYLVRIAHPKVNLVCVERITITKNSTARLICPPLPN